MKDTELFGELRSLMNEVPGSRSEREDWGDRLQKLLCEADAEEVWHEEMTDYTRGFPHHWEQAIELDSPLAMEVVPAKLPTARFSLNLSYHDLSISELCEHPQRDQFEAFDLGPGCFRHGDFERFVKAFEGGGLRTLDLSGNELGSSQLELLATSSMLANLTHLEMQENVTDDEGLEILAKSEHLGSLESLSLKNSYYGGDAIAALLSNPKLARLRALDLYNNSYVADEVIDVLADAACVFSLEKLGLAGCGVDDENLERLVGSCHVKTLVKLDLSYNDDLTSEGLIPFFEAGGETLANLEKLYVASTGVDGVAVSALAGSANMTRLRVLGLHYCQVGNDGAVAIAASDHLGALEEVTLSLNRVGDKGAIALAKTDRLPSMRSLTLGDNKIGERGYEALIDSPHIAWLDYFSLPKEQMSKELYARIKDSKHLTEAQVQTYWSECSTKELESLAAEYGIAGRSKMKRDALIEAVRARRLEQASTS